MPSLGYQEAAISLPIRTLVRSGEGGLHLTLATAAREGTERVTQAELDRALYQRRKGEGWDVILPEVAQLRISTEGDGVLISLRISRDAPAAVRIAKPGEETVGTIVKQDVSIWDKYPMGRDDLAEKLGISGPKTSALILELALDKDPECSHLLTRKKSAFKGNSKKAPDLLREALKTSDVEAFWIKHRHRFGAKRTA